MKIFFLRVQCLPSQGCWISALPLVTLRPIECNLPRIKSGFLFELAPSLSLTPLTSPSQPHISPRPALRGIRGERVVRGGYNTIRQIKHSQGPWLLRPRRSVREVYTIKKQSPKYTEDQTPAIIINQGTAHKQQTVQGPPHDLIGINERGRGVRCVVLNTNVCVQI